MSYIDIISVLNIINVLIYRYHQPDQILPLKEGTNQREGLIKDLRCYV